MMYSSWDTEWDRYNFLSFWVIFCPFSPNPLTTQKIKNLKLIKNTWRYYNFTHLHHDWQSYDVWFLRYRAQQTEFFVILEHFYSFTRKSKFWKNEQHTWYKHFTNVYHKWLSYDVWFQRYEVQQTQFLSDHFLPFYPPAKSKFWKIEKNFWRYYHFTHVYHK